MEKLYVIFSVQIRDTQYSYNATEEGEAELVLQTTRELLNTLDAGNLFNSALQCAIVDFDTLKEEDR